MKGIKHVMIFIILAGIFLLPLISFANSGAGDLKPYIESVEQAEEGMTLWHLVKTGGFIMIVLAVLSMVAGALIVYNFMTLKISNLAPEEFTEVVLKKVEGKKKKLLKDMCEPGENVIARIVMAGIKKRSKGIVFAREAMEDCTRKEIGNLWQGISYLSDIATIAPLIGLLGTVLGMIQAFNVIAFQTAVVKPILLAGGVSKAMITTAAGLIVAIPTMLFYSYFRGRVLQVSNIIESHSSDIMKGMEELL